MTENCCATTGSTIMLLPCSGGSNVGQLANRAAVELTMEGFGRIFCLAGIGGRLSGFVQSAKDADSLIAIDGCEVGCCKAVLEDAGVSMAGRGHLVVTECGIEKNKNFNLNEEDVELVKQAVKNANSEPAATTGVPGGGSGCCS